MLDWKSRIAVVIAATAAVAVFAISGMSPAGVQGEGTDVSYPGAGFDPFDTPAPEPDAAPPQAPVTPIDEGTTPNAGNPDAAGTAPSALPSAGGGPLQAEDAVPVFMLLGIVGLTLLSVSGVMRMSRRPQ